ncbi:MAG: hypothetical protein ACP5GX_05205 [Anaerolineae bacterium]
MLKQRRFHLTVGFALALTTVALTLLATTARADGPGYTLNWWTVAGGGGTAMDAGGQYTLDGTAGQPEAGTLGGGDYILGGGFWAGGEVMILGEEIHLPLILRYP